MTDAPVAVPPLSERLARFARENRFRGKGPLSVALVVTRHARTRGLPLDPEALLTDGGGQVLGLGKGAVQAVLAEHGVAQVLAREGGRTSRGSIGNMRAYGAWLNADAGAPGFSVAAVEGWWVERVREHFAAKPFVLRLDPALSLAAVIRGVLRQAEARQRETPGATVVGTVMQHLVGAKLDLALGAGRVSHHGASQNDEGRGRAGDFEVGDSAVHVTNAPTEALIARCDANLAAGLRPVVVTSRKGVAGAEALAEEAGIGDRVETVEFDRFLAMNLHEMAGFSGEQRPLRVRALVDRYNEIVDEAEGDPALRIEVAAARGR